MNVISHSEFNKRLWELDKEADEKVGEGVVPFEDIFEIAIKEQLLSAYKAGMTYAAELAGDASHVSNHDDARNVILTTRDSLKEIPL